MADKNFGYIIKNHLKSNKHTYIGLFLFYIIGVILGAFAVNDLDFQQKDDMTKYLNGFLKILNSDEINRISLFKISLSDNFKLLVLFWGLGFTVIGIPVYYLIIGMRGFTTGFSSGVIMGVLGTKGIFISAFCFLPKEIIVIPCLIALGVNGIKLSRGILKSWLKKSIKDENGVMQKIGPYSFVTVFFSIFLFLATIFETYISSGTLFFLNS
ncbi:stage II sporulation protein M [Ruminiclostridium sufflavum DSM 19573]|uniref:Stage II sporulation protein M n=1 Tax=Ruminiclostridium sufflavum DSM 19573 TaxID=1121337 RepID=A0A318XXS6_9FIRM|nr:stage II sporulation protein M [Ruminiclostridium sufflavum]PYG87597.1 stage II sporulation protein M [Ruminiclostridium sufflavum DSM 19573]